MIKTKKCSKCKEEKATSEFYKNKRSKDGLRSQCKECRKQYQQSEKYKDYQQSEKVKAYKKEYMKEYRQTKEYKELNRKASNKYLQGKGIPRIRVDGKQKRISRYTMEQEIGRKLLPIEIVHHKDGDPFNNNIENLYLCKNHKEHMEIHGEIRYLRKEMKDFTF